LIVAEAVMMGLAPALGRQVAHDLVYDCCRAALTSGTPFLDALTAEPKIAAAMDREALAHLVDPANYLGAAPAMTRRLLAKRQG
jgi:3-carboxy-cis,cis-muconate cycloisomerase